MEKNGDWQGCWELRLITHLMESQNMSALLLKSTVGNVTIIIGPYIVETYKYYKTFKTLNTYFEFVELLILIFYFFSFCSR